MLLFNPRSVAKLEAALVEYEFWYMHTDSAWGTGLVTEHKI